MINKNASKKTARVIAFKSKVCNYLQTTMISRRKKPLARILLTTIFILYRWELLRLDIADFFKLNLP